MSIFSQADIPLEPRPPGAIVPLTPAQAGAWNYAAERGSHLSDVKLCAITTRLLGALDCGRLKMSVEALVRRHESLRTTIGLFDGSLGQQVGTVRDCQFESIDLTGLPRMRAEEEAKRLGQDFADEKINLAEGPLFIAKLFRLSHEENVLIVVADHVIADARSCDIINREIWSLYTQANSPSFSLPPLPIQFPDYAFWQQKLFSAAPREHQAYWTHHLADAPCTRLPCDFYRQEEEYAAGDRSHFPLGKVLSDELRELARRERAPLPLLTMSIYAAAMSSWCKQEELVIRALSHGRQGKPELENVIGFIAVPILVRVNVRRSLKPVELLKHIHVEFDTARDHQCFMPCPVDTDLWFNWIGDTPLQRSRSGALKSDRLNAQPFWMQPSSIFNSSESSFKLKTSFSDTPAGIVASVAFRDALFKRTTIELFGRNLRRYARAFASCPHSPIAAMHL